VTPRLASLLRFTRPVPTFDPVATPVETYSQERLSQANLADPCANVTTVVIRQNFKVVLLSAQRATLCFTRNSFGIVCFSWKLFGDG
jgi:hypothetical protein